MKRDIGNLRDVHPADKPLFPGDVEKHVPQPVVSFAAAVPARRCAITTVSTGRNPLFPEQTEFGRHRFETAELRHHAGSSEAFRDMVRDRSPAFHGEYLYRHQR
ncbi:MAG TPA: hypothetical protein VGC14_17525 [Rhizobium sp.]